MKTILLTGATGYIGSHTWVELLNRGYRVVGIDNLLNSNRNVLDRITTITKRSTRFIEADVRDTESMTAIMQHNSIDAVIHFAGLKAVGESVKNPMMYWDYNVVGLHSLIRAMKKCKVHDIVFSSSATVYGDPKELPLKETSELAPMSAYGHTKLSCEYLLNDLMNSDPKWHAGILRYFNPVGAHESGLIGEDPLGIPNNLMPFVAQTAIGKRAKLSVFGYDYNTHDGTGIRDYIHVTDLALGHIKALEVLSSTQKGFTVNLGTGKGYSVLDVVAAYEKACGHNIPREIVERRPGDVEACWADTTAAEQLLDWKATRDLDQMCKDSWNWQSKNPKGYE